MRQSSGDCQMRQNGGDCQMRQSGGDCQVRQIDRDCQVRQSGGDSGEATVETVSEAKWWRLCQVRQSVVQEGTGLLV